MRQATKKVLGAAAGAAATGAALAGAYYYYGAENAAKHRSTLKAWANKAEREIVREAKKFKKKALTDANINSIIAGVTKQYESTKDLDAADVREFVATMRERWQAAKKTIVAKRGKQRKVSAKKRGGK